MKMPNKQWIVSTIFLSSFRNWMKLGEFIVIILETWLTMKQKLMRYISICERNLVVSLKTIFSSE